VVECGGVWWSVVECGGVWWSVVECAGVRVLRVSEGEVINIHTMRRSEEECGGVRRNEVVV
jgi:hypothetical protein